MSRADSVLWCFGSVTAIVVGLLVMMWPILTKVQYEKLPSIFSTRKMWFQIGISLVLNWIIGPFVSESPSPSRQNPPTS